ncbi:HAMP domain-containing histidine kinase [bacterium]|nr:HAMP domain-containing histidine kinase [bacterium]
MQVSIDDKSDFYSDTTRIEIVLNNLLSNAIKYADTNRPNPFVDVRVDTNDLGVTICVADNGEGIAPEYLPRIFEMFFRATNRSTGSGLGLYIVSEIVHKMGGTIEVDSKIGEGSNFVVTLPDLAKESC